MSKTGLFLAGCFAGLIVVGWIVLSPRPDRRPVVAPMTNEVSGPRLPAPSMAPSASPMETLADETPHTNFLARLLKGDEQPRLTPEQVEGFLAANKRNAESLLAAFRVCEDKAFLAEAKEKFPNDPRVAYTALFTSETPEERSQWLERFRESAPDNALPDYVSALDKFRVGQTDDAVQALMAATAKGGCQDYALDFFQNAEEAYRAAGYAPGQSKAAAAFSVHLPELKDLKELGRKIAELSQSYRASGDEASAQAAVQLGMNLAHHLDGQAAGRESQPLINHLVGMAIERIMLDTLPPESPYGDGGQTVKDRFDELVRQRDMYKEFTKDFDYLSTLSDQDVANYFDRTKIFGEVEALKWLANRRREE